MNRHLPTLLFTLLLAGCSTITLVESQPVQVASAYTVNPQRTWSRLRDSNVELWTVDGFSLQAIRFFDPVEDGDPLFQPNGSEQKRPTFRSDMLASEIEEFVTDSLSAAGAQQVTARALTPVKFGSADGFRFELEMLSADGLEMAGLVTGAVRDEKLYLITYSGTRAHYYPRFQGQVERIFASLRFTEI